MRVGYKMTKLGEIPEDWEVVKLGEIGEFKNGINKGKEDFGFGSPLVNLNDVFGKTIVESQNLGLVNTTDKEKKEYELKEGDVLFIRSSVKPMGVGLTAIINEDLRDTVYSGFIIRFRENGFFSKIFKRYCFYDSGFRRRLLAKSTVSANANINQKALNTLFISCPPLQEQKKIAQILSTVDEKIDLTQSKIEATQALKKGLMQQLLTKGIGHTEFKESKLGEIPLDWEVVKLGEMLSKIKGGGTPTRDVDDYWNGKIPWATVKDLKSGILNDVQEYVSEKGLKESSANLIPKWTLIIATRMALGKAVFFTKAVAINQDLKALYTKDTLDKMYLFHWFFSNTEKILELGSGSTVKGIRLEVLKGIFFLLPPLQEQKKIAQILSKVDEKIDLLQEKKQAYQTMKKGLMQQLLTGQVRVK